MIYGLCSVRASAYIPCKWNERYMPWEQLDLWVSSCHICTEKSQSSGKTICTYKVKCGYEKSMRDSDETVDVISVSLLWHTLHWICWVQHENKTRPLSSASAVASSESVERKHRRGGQTIPWICVCWCPHSHSQESQIHFQSEVSPTEGQDRQFKSIILFGLWFWNHCTVQRVVLCGWWLQCYNYHYNYTGMFPSWRAPWNYNPVTWPGFLIVLVRWAIAFGIFGLATSS